MPPLSNGVASSSKPSEEDFWNTEYANEDHLQAFARALDISDQIHDGGDQSPFTPRSPPASSAILDLAGVETKSNISASRRSENGVVNQNQTWKYGPDNGALSAEEPKVRKLTATSDFAPIHQRISRRKHYSSQQGWTYHLIRWPLLGFIFLIISLEFGAYVFTRQIVNVFEWLGAWRGSKGKLRLGLRNAQSYIDWTNAAKKLDTYLGFDEWKETDEDGYYDYILVKRVKRTLTRLRAAKDTRGLMDALAVCVRSNFAGTEGVKMYSETFFGTKRLVEAHINEVATSLDFIRTSTDVSLEEKRAFFRAINKNYGSSALCLSGGASFGYYHFGVIKAFLEADLLPRIITGTSAGGLVAALLCTRTDTELKELLVPELANKITACEDPFPVWFRRFRKTGARFDSVEWARKAMFFTRGSLTFKEAYERTGRALNVSVVPSDRHSPTILLNHLTAPNCLIWSAILASAAVPGILNPVVLMAKDRDGQVKPHNLGGSRFKDGSLREDIPLGSLHTQFNCNFSIVSQTNPHIHLFFFAPRGSVGRPVAHRKGKGWRGGFILSALESYIKLDLSKHFKVIRDLDLMPQILQSDWSGVFLQRFSGDLTITPRSTISDWFRILSDPTPPRLEQMLHVGQRVSWPALHMVRNRMTIERAILRGRAEVRATMHRDKTSNDRTAIAHPSGTNTPLQIPIESDADAGFALRSRRIRSSRTAAPTASAIFDDTTENSRGGSVLRKRGKKDLRYPLRLDDSNFPERSSGSTVSFPMTDRPSGSSSGSNPRTYATSLGETFRHVRTSSLSAFGRTNFSPFRSLRNTPSAPVVPGVTGSGNNLRPIGPGGISQDQNPDGAGTGVRRRSNLSITRWFGGVSESSSEEEDGDGDDNDNEEEVLLESGGDQGRIDALGLELDFVSALDEDEDDDDELGTGNGNGNGIGNQGVGEEDGSGGSEGEGVVPIPGGERVSQDDIQASTRVLRGEGERVRSSSPPSQDNL